jgi:O-antigen/teichoic acid export membrane protein
MSAAGDDRLAFPRRELRPRTARGGILNAVFLGGGEALALLQGLIVTALLGPSAIGLYGIVTTTAVTIAQLRRVGIDEAFVQQSEQHQEEEFQRAFSLELSIGLSFSALIVCLAPLVAVVYGDERLLALMLAISYLPTVFALQAPQWVFYRRMDFLRLRILQFLIPSVTFAVAVPLAAITGSIWSLIVGPFVGNAVAVVAAARLSPYRLRPRFDSVARRRYLRFSWPIFLTAFATLILLQGQVLAFDLHGGLKAAGYITLALTLTRYADRADQIATTTIYPAISAIQDRLPTLEELFVKSSRITMMWSLPFCGLLILFSPDLVSFVLGKRWEPAIALVQGLAGATALQQLGYNWFSFYRARGQSAPQAVESGALIGAFAALAVPGLFLFGTGGFIAGRVLASLAMLAVRRWYVVRLFPGQRLAALGLRALIPVGGAALAVGGIRLALWGSDRTELQAAAELVVFLGGTVGLTWLAERPLLRELALYLRARSPASDGQVGAGGPLLGGRVAQGQREEGRGARDLETEER